MKLIRSFLVLLLDISLFLIFFVGNLLSFKGVIKSGLLVILFLTLGRGIFVESAEPTRTEFYTVEYVPLSRAAVFEQRNLLKSAEENLPSINASAFLVVDLNTNTILYEKNLKEKLAPASTTKLMTALVAQDIYELDEILEVPLKCAQISGMKSGFYAGEEVTYGDLLHACLISSSNDAACTLANYKYTESEFVAFMNAKAEQLGLENTSFTNPVGFDSFSFDHFSSVEDLYKLSLEIRSDAVLKNIVAKKQYTLKSGQIPRRIYTTNNLLQQIPESIGIKTGTTVQAGQVLIYEYEDEVNDLDLIVVLMGSNDRFGDAKKILDWVLTYYVLI